MDKIIGLGTRGCAIAEEFTAYPEYRVYKIASESSERGVLNLGTFKSMEDYEKALDENEITAYLRSIRPEDEVLVVVGGGEPITGAILKILKCIQESTFSILYVVPDRDMSSWDEQRNDKIAFKVLQEYARSGIIHNIIIAHYPTVEGLIGDASIQEYDQKISYFISYAVAMVNFYQHSDSVMNGVIKPLEWASISTIGVGSLDKNDIDFLFPLEKTQEIHFYFGVPLRDLEEDQSLMKRIKEYIKSFKTDEQTVSFSVHPTSFEGLMVLCQGFSTEIQPLL